MPSDGVMTGELFFWDDIPHVTGFLVIGDQSFEIAGVRRSKTRISISGRKIRPAPSEQKDMFDDAGSGESG